MVMRLRQLASHPLMKLATRALAVTCGLLVLVLIGSTARAVPQSTSAVAAIAGSASALASAMPSQTSSSGSASPAPEPSPLTPHARRATPDDPVHINTAALDDLQRLPGIGPKRATAILSLRGKLGRFREVEDLMRVKGIGRATLKKLRPLVRLD